MKKSDELKIKKAEKMRALNAILDKATAESQRSLTADENTQYDALKREVEEIAAQIERALFSENNPIETPATETPETQRSIPAPHIAKPTERAYNTGKAMREFMLGGAAGLTGLEKEAQSELSRGITTNGLLIPSFKRAITPSSPTTNASAIDVIVDPNLSVFGKEPLWQKMGITVLPGLTSSVKVNKKAAAVAGKYAAEAAVTAQGGSPSAQTLAPERYGITDLFDKELLAQGNPMVQAAIINDLIKGADRAMTAEIYTVALAAATEVAAGALTVAGFNALMAAVDGDGSFAMDRGSFFSAKGVAIDSGSGRFLVSLGAEQGVGLTHDGAKAFYSTLFDDGAASQYVVYGDWSEIWGGLWGAIEVLVNPYSYQNAGQVEVTVNRLADFVCRNSAAFVKSPDLEI